MGGKKALKNWKKNAEIRSSNGGDERVGTKSFIGKKKLERGVSVSSVELDSAAKLDSETERVSDELVVTDGLAGSSTPCLVDLQASVRDSSKNKEASNAALEVFVEKPESQSWPDVARQLFDNCPKAQLGAGNATPLANIADPMNLHSIFDVDCHIDNLQCSDSDRGDGALNLANSSITWSIAQVAAPNMSSPATTWLKELDCNPHESERE